MNWRPGPRLCWRRPRKFAELRSRISGCATLRLSGFSIRNFPPIRETGSAARPCLSGSAAARRAAPGSRNRHAQTWAKASRLHSGSPFSREAAGSRETGPDRCSRDRTRPRPQACVLHIARRQVKVMLDGGRSQQRVDHRQRMSRFLPDRSRRPAQRRAMSSSTDRMRPANRASSASRAAT